MRHYSLDEIERYMNNDCGLLRRYLINRHLKRCDECLSRIENLKNNDTLLTSLRDAIEDAPEAPSKRVLDRIGTLIDGNKNDV